MIREEVSSALEPLEIQTFFSGTINFSWCSKNVLPDII